MLQQTKCLETVTPNLAQKQRQTQQHSLKSLVKLGLKYGKTDTILELLPGYSSEHANSLNSRLNPQLNYSLSDDTLGVTSSQDSEGNATQPAP